MRPHPTPQHARPPCRLGDDGELVFGCVVFCKVTGARLAGFLAHKAYEVYGDREIYEKFGVFL